MKIIKHTSLLILLISVFNTPLRSQIGIKGGPVLTDIIFEVEGQIPYLGYETNSLRHKLPNLTYQLGIFKAFKITNKFEFQPELLLTNKGLNYGAKYIYDDITYLVKIQYLELPLLLKYNFSKNEQNHFSILLGPYFSYAINNTRIIEVDDHLQKEKMNNINKFDWGVAAGISYNFAIRSNQFVIDLRTSYGLVDIMEYADGYIPEYLGPDKERARNVNIAFTLGYLLNIGRTNE